jgi:phage virion morphogenesis protein
MAIIITVNDHMVLDVLNRLASQMQNMQPVMTAIGAELKARVSSRFETETDPEGHPWAEWMPATKKSYPKDGNHKVLDRYSDMLNSLGYEADAASVKVGFGQPYAAYHEWGTKHMKRRGLLFADPDTRTLAPEDTRLVLDVLARFLQEPLP